MRFVGRLDAGGPRWAVEDVWHPPIQVHVYRYSVRVDAEGVPALVAVDGGIHGLRLQKRPFSHGAMRVAYYGRMVRAPPCTVGVPWRVAVVSHAPCVVCVCVGGVQAAEGGGAERHMVVKLPRYEHPPASRASLERDVKSQALAAYYADKFNAQRPAPRKRIEFVDALVGVRDDGPGGVLHSDRFFAVEPVIVGEYRKFSNNGKFVDDTVVTVHAYSHFTWGESGGKFLVADVQGVRGDAQYTLTDPQVHSHDGRDFGQGNRGMTGVDDFFGAHQCTDLCATFAYGRHDLQPPGLGARTVSCFDV